MKLALMIGAPDMEPEADFYVRTPTGPYSNTLRRAAGLGFDGVEILAAKRQVGDLFALRTALAQQGVEVAGVNSGRLLSDYGLVLLCGDSRQCAMTRVAMYDLIRLAAPFDTHINIGTFRGLPRQFEEALAVDRLVEVLRQFADYARSLDVELLIEPQNRHEFPFIAGTEEGVQLVERVNHENVGMMLDTFHMAAEGEDMLRSIRRATPYLHHVHFLDHDRNPPSQASHKLDTVGIIRELARQGYRGYLSMPLSKAGDDLVTARAVDYLRGLIKNV